jgi:hypothetical protein
MDTSSFDKKIGELQANLKKTETDMEATTRSFIDALIAYVIDWNDKKALKVITQYPSRAKALGKEGLMPVRIGIAKLKSEMRNIVESEFLQDRYWVHRVQGDATKPDYNYASSSGSDKQPPMIFENGIKGLFGHLGKLLFRYKLIDTADRDAAWRLSADGDVTYNESVVLDGVPAAAIQKYKGLANFRKQVLSSLAEEQTAKERAEVLDLWNS